MSSTCHKIIVCEGVGGMMMYKIRKWTIKINRKKSEGKKAKTSTYLKGKTKYGRVEEPTGTVLDVRVSALVIKKFEVLDEQNAAKHMIALN